jgi:hypothetical protein
LRWSSVGKRILSHFESFKYLGFVRQRFLIIRIYCVSILTYALKTYEKPTVLFAPMVNGVVLEQQLQITAQQADSTVLNLVILSVQKM